MIKIFKPLVFLLAIVLVVQCDREQSVEAEDNTLQEPKILSFDALPAEIKSKIITAETELKATVTHHKALKPFGSPKFNTIHQRLGKDGSQSYTLGLEKTSEGLYYDNLVINQDTEGNTSSYIIRYQPESGWYRKHKTEGLGYPHYSGAIHIFSETGTLLSSVTLASGIPIQKTTKDDTHVGHRANDQEMSCDVIDIEYVGGCAGEECWWSEIIITLNCTGAGGGGSDGMYDDGGYGQGGANGPQHEGGQHGGGGGGSPVNTVPVEEDEEPPVEEEDMDDQIIIDTTFVNTPCLMAVYTAMGGSETFKKYLQNFDGDFSVADLRFSADDNFSTNPQIDEQYHNAMAITMPPLDSNLINITFNTDTSLGSNILKKPDAYKAVALIHEMLHAEMYRKMLDALKTAEINQTTLNWQDWPNDTDFEDFVESLENKYFGIFDYYTRYDWNTSTPNNAQHQAMAQHYRNTIKEALTDYDPTLTEQQKEALSWIGLREASVIAWQNLSEEEKSAIIDTLNEIKNNSPNECD